MKNAYAVCDRTSMRDDDLIDSFTCSPALVGLQIPRGQQQIHCFEKY